MRAKREGLLKTNASVRDAINEQLRINQSLIQKANDKAYSDDEDHVNDTESEGSEDEDEEARVTRVKNSGKKAIASEINDLEESELPKTGLLGLPFMRKAAERQREQARLDAANMLEQLDEEEFDDDDDDDDDEHNDIRKTRLEHAAIEDEDQDEKLKAPTKDGETIVDEPAPETRNGQQVEEVAFSAGLKTVTSGPINVEAQPTARGKRKAVDRAIDTELVELGGKSREKKAKSGKDSSHPAWLFGSESASKSIERKGERHRSDKEGDLATTQVNVMGNKPQAGQPKRDDKEYSIQEEEEDHEEDGEDEEEGLARENHLNLVREAFAGDDVQAAFDAEKAALVDDELPDGNPDAAAVALPGWGSWAMEGPSKKQKAREERARAQAQQKRATAAGQRKDASKKHLILSEKVRQQRDRAAVVSRVGPLICGLFAERNVLQCTVR